MEGLVVLVVLVGQLPPCVNDLIKAAGARDDVAYTHCRPQVLIVGRNLFGTQGYNPACTIDPCSHDGTQCKILLVGILPTTKVHLDAMQSAKAGHLHQYY